MTTVATSNRHLTEVSSPASAPSLRSSAAPTNAASPSSSARSGVSSMHEQATADGVISTAPPTSCTTVNASTLSSRARG